MKEWYTIAELAEKTSIPDTTIRRYIAKFNGFFVFKGGSRSRRYEETAIKILIRIKNLFDSGYETDQVDATLRNEFAMVVDDGDKNEKESATPALATAEDIVEIKEALKQQQEFNKFLVEKLDHQEKFIKESIERRDAQLMESIRTMQEERRLMIETASAVAAEQQEKKGFFSRLFGK